MKFEVRLGAQSAKPRVVELDRAAGSWRVTLDGTPLDADAVEVAPNIFFILIAGHSYEVRITPASGGALTLQCGLAEFTAEVDDPRSWPRRRHGAMEAAGRQQIVAPMPGKVVRVLVQVGDQVTAGQGLLVVEAMKMQNEIRSPKSGTVERLFAREGQPINAGDVLCEVS
jgi:biotin carboxyl carrier protein